MFTSADRARARLQRDLPNTVAGSSYRVRLTHDGSGPATIELTTSSPDVTVTVGGANGTAVGNSTVSGGDVVVRYDGSAVVIERA